MHVNAPGFAHSLRVHQSNKPSADRMEATDVVLSGIGALFPESTNVQELGRHLLDNKDLTSETTRWKYDDKLDSSTKVGQIPYHHFDNVFFGMTSKLAINSDPTFKLTYVRSFEAIIDAGYNPNALRGRNIGVMTATGMNEFETNLLVTPSSQKFQGYSIMGCARTMSPNRVAYILDFRGPSCSVTCSWEDAHMLLQRAAGLIREGQCEGVLVIAAQLNRFPNIAALLRQLGLASNDGTTRSFAADGSGSANSDAAVAFFLQRGDQAKRCYAKVLAAGVHYSGSDHNINICLPSPRGIERFLTDLYSSHRIDPKRIAYLEADGWGELVRDECELNAIDAALLKGCHRSQPLLVGSVKSNLGQTGAACGFTAICKAVVAMETGIIPANINLGQLNQRATGLREGRMQVVESNTPLHLSGDAVVAVNTLGLGSSVGHTVLQANPRTPDGPQDPSQHLPRLITVSGRTEEGVAEVIKKIQGSPFDTNFYRLVQDVFSESIRGYDFRSYVILPSPTQEIPAIVRMEKRTLWFVYSGMGSQWAGMGAGLMRLPVFAETIERLHAVLQPKGVDLKAIITETGPKAFDNILKSFVGITACQIALTNVLTAVGLVPDGIIGHSVGELGCAYADGCVNEEQAILTSWARGSASNEATLVKGMMAAIGLGYKDVLPRLPPSIDVACRNSSTSCTLSGPTEDVKAFVKKLSDEGVFARAVNVSDIAYHSRYIQPAAPLLREKLEQVLQPAARSSRWVTTSVPAEKQDSDLGKFCSAEYMTNNLLSPVLFEEGLACVPAHSVLVEIAPHGLLQAILKRAMPDTMHIPLTQRDHPDPLHFLLNALGRVSFAGHPPKVAGLYPDVEFPVPRGTASLAQLVTTLADDSTYNVMLDDYNETDLEVHELDIDAAHMVLDTNHYALLSDSLMLMWCCMNKNMIGGPITTCPAVFRNVVFRQLKDMPAQAKTEELRASYMRWTNLMEVLDDTESIVASALIMPRDDDFEAAPPLPRVDMASQDAVVVRKEELYRDLEAHGLKYSPRNQQITSIQMGETDWFVTVLHRDRLQALLESMLQIYILHAVETRHAVCIPTRIQRIDMDPTKVKRNAELVLRLNLCTGILEGPGIYVSGVDLQETRASSHSSTGLATELPEAVSTLQSNSDEKVMISSLTATSLDSVKLEFLGVNPLGCSDGLSGHVDFVGVPKAGGARVMGVGQWLGDHLRPRLDPLLRWPVPKAWSSADAATVPFAYATMYHALVVKAKAQKGESILVQEGASALGQAAIRVAIELGCNPVFTTVRDDKQRTLLAKLFPQLEPSRVLTRGDGGSFEWRLRVMTGGRGVRLVVNTLPGAELHASMRCLAPWGRLLHHQRRDMLDATTIGSSGFLQSIAFFGFSGHELFRASDLNRAAVFDSVRRGLESGAVQPIVGTTVISPKTSTLSLADSAKTIVKVSPGPSTGSEQCDPRKCYVVWGREDSETLLMAARLSLLGARHVLAAVESPPSSALVRQRQRALRRQHGTALHVLQVRGRSAKAVADILQAAAAVAPIHTAVVLVKDESSLAVPALLDKALSSSPGVGLVLLAERAGAASSLAALVERRNAAGLRTVCLAAPLAEAADHLADLLCAPPAVTVLPSAVTVAKAADSHPGDCVPREPAGLAALGRAAARLPASGEPRLRELTSLGCTGHSCDNFPLFALPPLGVLDESSEGLTSLAIKMHSPVFVVEALPRCGVTLQDTASSLVQAILSRQPHGPYNLLGWRLSTVLALEVQRQLEAAGKRGVLFLVHGDVGLVRQWAAQQRVEAPPSDPEAQRGAELANAYMRALAEHELDMTSPFQWRVVVIRRSVDEEPSLCDNDPNIFTRTVTDAALGGSSLCSTLNDHAAWSHLAGMEDLRLAVKTRSSRSEAQSIPSRSCDFRMAVPQKSV